MRPQICRWHEYADIETLERVAANWISASATRAIERNHAFHIVLAGGSTPRGIYEKLKYLESPWSAWHIYFGDERCLAVGDPERNSTMAYNVWLSQVPVPPQQVHVIPGELGPAAGAQCYAEVLATVPMFDLSLLGLGEDGHTASLFPGKAWGSDLSAPAVLAIEGAPKRPPQRISLSARRLSLSREVLVCVAGASKKQALTSWRAGKVLPISAIIPENGLDILVSNEL